MKKKGEKLVDRIDTNDSIKNWELHNKLNSKNEKLIYSLDEINKNCKMEINYSYNQTKEIFELLKNTFDEIEDASAIPITFSDEIPPLLLKKKGVDIYPVYNLMGAYFPETKNIIIYLKGIKYVVEKQSGKSSDQNFHEKLLKIVILHEIGHWWFYNVKGYLELNEDTSDDSHEYIHEWIAQMFAYLCLDNEEDREFMMEFSKHQPEEYQNYCKDVKIDANTFTRLSKLLCKTHYYKHIGKNHKKDILTGLKMLNRAEKYNIID